jgi:hypothetical protein
MIIEMFKWCAKVILFIDFFKLKAIKTILLKYGDMVGEIIILLT